MKIVKYKKIFFALSGVLVALSIAAIAIWGLPFGTDFTGGSILEVSFVEGERPELALMNERLGALELGAYSLRPSGEQNYVLRSRELSVEEKDTILSAFSNNGELTVSEERFNSIGPVVGNTLKNKSYVALAIVLLMILAFISFAFRKVQGEKGGNMRGPASWKYGLTAILALLHDVLIPTGAYILLSRYTSAEIDLLFMTALLAILGFSVHDTIVVFDRVRENLRTNAERNVREDFETTVGKSISETLARSINTSVTTLLAIVALFVLGSEATRNFTFVMLVGILVGAYSSIFFASTFLTVFADQKEKGR